MSSDHTDLSQLFLISVVTNYKGKQQILTSQELWRQETNSDVNIYDYFQILIDLHFPP